MPRQQTTRILPYTDYFLFDLVADVPSYPSFLPWCHRVVVLEQSPNHMLADMYVGHGPFKDVFRSHVLLHRPSSITVQYKQGPLKHLETIWQFKHPSEGASPTGSSCQAPSSTQVTFVIDFAFKRGLLNALIRPFFHEAFARMVQAFETEAKKRLSSCYTLPEPL